MTEILRVVIFDEAIRRDPNSTLGYLRAWLGLWKNAAPCDMQSRHMQLVAERRAVLRDLYLESDPGIGTVIRVLFPIAAGVQ